jgi:hypothetical protein
LIVLPARDGLDGIVRVDHAATAADPASMTAPRWPGLTGPNPTDRGKPGCNDHLLVGRGGIPLAVCLPAANTTTRCYWNR